MTTASGTRADPAAPGETAPVEEGFVARWSRRKQAARNDEKPLQEPSPSVAVSAVSPAPATASVPVLTDKDMPPIEGLTGESDFSGFLSPGVSEDLRRRALYKLFHLPEFNTRCPLDSEYYDCHGYEPLGDIVTHEMREALEREAEKLKLAARDALLAPDKTATASLPPGAQQAAPAAVAAPPAKPDTPITHE
jgi:hypothetical protein